ncbi:hypothetical protein EHS25_003783 [Saitozyma podzolica]|uniref:Uncharacterized protein n=1 Tax=Saitozyma podzolica TaxID=1890683 RepID=A0A427Y3I7_9TREE|nr:hypothetical protein EHS25_003783 [Saitozyma podzolica]
MESFESRASSRATEKNQSDLDREVPPPAPCVSESPSDTESFDLIPVRRPDDTSNARQLTEFLAWTRANQHARQLESICQSEDAADKMHEAQEEYKCLKSFSRALRRLTDRQTFFARYYGWAWDTVLKDDIVSRTTRLDSVVDSIWGDDFRKPSESQGGPSKEVPSEAHSGEVASNKARSSEESSSGEGEDEESSSEESGDEDPQEGSEEGSDEGSEAAESSDDSSSEDSE